jgi:hypothetical protein
VRIQKEYPNRELRPVMKTSKQGGTSFSLLTSAVNG